MKVSSKSISFLELNAHVSRDDTFGSYKASRGSLSMYKESENSSQRQVILSFIKELSSSKRVIKDIMAIQKIEPSDTAKEFIAEYGNHGERKPFLWKWVDQGLRLTMLSCVDTEHYQEVHTIKMLGVMFDVMLDDAADVIQDEQLVEQMLRIPFEEEFIQREKVPVKYLGYFDFTQKVWKAIIQRVQSLPLYHTYSKLFEFDYRQLLNCMRYALIVNHDPSCVNLAEHDLYQPHNMHMVISSTIDLMASSNFDKRETGMLREAISSAQAMGRIGNAVTTWQRELHDDDFTSGIYAMALKKNVLKPDDLLHPDPEFIEEKLLASQMEEELLVEWGNHRLYILEVAPRVRSVNLYEMVNGLQSLIAMHLGSRGLK